MTYPEEQSSEPGEWDEDEDEAEDEDDCDGASVEVVITADVQTALLLEAYAEISEAAEDQPWNERLQRCKRLLRLGIRKFNTVKRG